MKAMQSAQFLALVLFTPLLCAQAEAAPTNWLVGSWAMQDDGPSGGKVYMDFYRDSKADLRGPDTSHVLCDYAQSNEAVELSCTARGQTTTVQLEFAKDHAQFRTFNGATFRKVPDQAGDGYAKSGWNICSSAVGKFSIMMYGVPTVERHRVTFEGNEGSEFFMAALVDRSNYTLQYIAMPRGGYFSDASRKQTYERYQELMLKQFRTGENPDPSFEIKRADDITFQGVPARRVEAVYTNAGGEFRHLTGIILTRGNIFYQVLGSVPADAYPTEAMTNYFASFRFIE